MEINIAQKEVRTVFLGGSVGQAVSGLLWLVSSALGTWVSVRYGVIALAIGGMFIFPMTQLALRILGRKAGLRRENPFNQLAMQSAFIIPFCLPVIGAASLYNINWFYPAFLIVVGAHYLPFMTLYGMWQYGVLAVALIGAGILVGMYFPINFATGGWIGAVILLIFAVYAFSISRNEGASR